VRSHQLSTALCCTGSGPSALRVSGGNSGSVGVVIHGPQYRLIALELAFTLLARAPWNQTAIEGE